MEIMSDADLERLRYPIGQFHYATPTPDVRRQWIDNIAALPTALRQNVYGLSPEQWRTPYRPGGWTVLQVVHHMADNDMNAYMRFKRALTEDAPLVGTFREDAWSMLADYTMPADNALSIITLIRERFTALYATLTDTDLTKTLVSPTYGEMSLDMATARFAWHGMHHLSHIQALIARMGWLR